MFENITSSVGKGGNASTSAILDLGDIMYEVEFTPRAEPTGSTRDHQRQVYASIWAKHVSTEDQRHDLKLIYDTRMSPDYHEYRPRVLPQYWTLL